MELGQKVRVDFKEVPKYERDCEVGTVIKKELRFWGTLREAVMVTIRFDPNYVKKQFRMAWGIGQIVLKEDDPRIEVLEISKG